MKKRLLMLLALAAACGPLAAAAQTGREWQDPAVNEVNRLPMRASFEAGGRVPRHGVVGVLPGGRHAGAPPGALDPRTGREWLGRLQELTRQGHTVILIAHDNTIAMQAPRISRLEDGRIVYDGDARSPEAFVASPLFEAQMEELQKMRAKDAKEGGAG